MGTTKRERQKANRDAARAAAWARYHRRRRIRFGAIGAVGLAIVIVAVIVFTGGSGKSSKKATATTKPASSGSTLATIPAGKAVAPTCPKADGSSTRTLNFTAAPPQCLTAAPATATFVTTKGTIVVSLDLTKTPKTANNFAFLAGWHYYDNTAIFRVDSSIDIVQGGSPHSEDASDTGPGYTIADEGAFTTDSTGAQKGPYSYTPGDLVMARTSSANSASAQFFFVTGANGSQLDAQGTYVVFGHVTTGLDVLQKIASAPTKTLSNGLGATPVPQIVITSVRVTQS